MDTCPDYVTSIWALYVPEAAGSFSLCRFVVIICHNLVSAVMLRSSSVLPLRKGVPLYFGYLMLFGSSVFSVGSVVFPASSLVREEMC